MSSPFLKIFCALAALPIHEPAPVGCIDKKGAFPAGWAEGLRMDEKTLYKSGKP
jgi:hypothetical protein